jgi:hypothetical protein
MGAIAFLKKPEESWVVAGWALRQILDDTASQSREDSEIATEFERPRPSMDSWSTCFAPTWRPD